VRRVTARAVSRAVGEYLQGGARKARVLGVFERACDLIADDGEVIGLVLPSVGEGPLNVLVGGRSGLFRGLQVGERAHLSRERIHVEGLWVDLSKAAVWEPRPDWGGLRERWKAARRDLSSICALCRQWAPEGSLLDLLWPGEGGAGLQQQLVLNVVRTAWPALQEGWAGEATRLRDGAVRLAGLGGGLTPAGDDFLTGLMLWAWLAHPTPEAFCQTLVDASVGSTTVLSAALLRAAARGECSSAWHRFLDALVGGREAEGEVGVALRGVLACGATSGADALAGFLAQRCLQQGGGVRRGLLGD